MLHRGIKALEKLQHLLEAEHLVRVEFVPVQNPDVLQGGGGLVAAVLFPDVEEGAAAHEIDVQKPVEDLHKIPDRHLRIDIHHAVSVGAEIGEML